MRTQNLGTAGVKVVADTSKYKKDINEAKGVTETFGRNAVASIGKITAAFGTLAGFAGFGYVTKQMLEATAELQKSATMAGVSVKAYQELTHAANQYAVSQDALTDGLKELTLRAEEFAVTGAGPGKESFERLGYSQNELNKKLKDTPALLLEVIDKMKGMENASKMRIADEIFGGTGGEQFMGMINAGSDAIERFTQEANNLGLVLDNETAAGAVAANKAIDTCTKQLNTQFSVAVSGLAPTIEELAKQMGAWVAQNKDLIAQKVPETIEDIGEGLKDIKSVYDAIPDDLKGPAGYGLVGALLFGGNVGKVIMGISLADKALSAMNMGLSDFVAKQKEGLEVRNKLFESIKDALGFNDPVDQEALDHALSVLGITETAFKGLTFAINEQTEGYDDYIKKGKAAADTNKAVADSLGEPVKTLSKEAQAALAKISDEYASLTMTAEDYEKLKLDTWFKKESVAIGGATKELQGLYDLKLKMIPTTADMIDLQNRLALATEDTYTTDYSHDGIRVDIDSMLTAQNEEFLNDERSNNTGQKKGSDFHRHGVSIEESQQCNNPQIQSKAA